MSNLKIACVSAALLFLSSTAWSATGSTARSVNLFEGPGRDYERIARLPAAAILFIHACEEDYSWCEVTWRGEHGWVRGNALDVRVRGRRLPVIDYGDVAGIPAVNSGRDSVHSRTAPFRDRDLDGDGLFDWEDWDRDGDGVRNADDLFPDHPYRD